MTGAAPRRDLGSVPELAARCAAERAETLWWIGCGAPGPLRPRHSGWYSAWRAWQDVELRLQSVQWYQAVASHRWVRADATEGYPDANWWWLWRGVMARRWALAYRGVRPAGHLRGTEIAIREPGTMVGSAVFHEE